MSSVARRAAVVRTIDDATGTVLALHFFCPAEDLHGYTTLLRPLGTQYGLPLALYGDRLDVFVRNDPPSDRPEDSLAFARRALTLAREGGQRSYEAWAARLLGEAIPRCDPPEHAGDP